jgi:class 3 adenylate cyclase
VASAGLRAAQRGETGTLIDTDYMGNEELEAYAPMDISDSDLHWSILATVDTSEAFAPISAFTRALVLVVTAIVFIMCLAAMSIAHLFIRPVRRLEAGAQRISAGEYDVTVPVTSRDEIGDLTKAFNEMSRNLTIKEDLLNEQRRENHRLLLSLMPEQVVERYRQGEEVIAQDHQDVTVIFADLVGLDQVQADLTSDEALGMTNELIRQIDAAAEDLGVERVRSVHNGYLASCGLTVPRLDNVRRTVDFALETQRIIDRFNTKTGHKLGLRAGIDAGSVSSGLVGRSSIMYDLWGGAVNLAYQVRTGSGTGAAQAGIFVTSSVYDEVRDIRQFEPAGTISVDGEEQRLWRLVERPRK